MKKTVLFAILLMAVATMVAVVSCKKEKQAETLSKTEQPQALASDRMNRIHAFQSLRDEINSGMKSSGTMTVEEMRQVIDLTFNYEHSEHMTYCENTVLDTFYIAMPVVDANGNVSETNVVATYNAFETALDNLMHSVTDGKDVPSCFSIIMPEYSSKTNGEIEVVFNRGQEGVRPDMTNLDSDFCLYWGYGLGACDPPTLTAFDDATDFLSQFFQFSETPPVPGYVLSLCNVEHVNYIAYDYPYNSNWVYWEPHVSPSCADHWLYVISGEYDPEPCICWDELMCYYNSVNQYVVSPNGALHSSPTYSSPYFSCSFDWHHLYHNKRSVRIHRLSVSYAEYDWINPNLPN